jgi:hypothetical protein
MKQLLLLLPAFFFLSISAQKLKTPPPAPVIIPKTTIAKTDIAKLKLIEDTLHQLSNEFTGDSVSEQRKKACYAFIPKLVRALKFDNSFYYPFDSFETIAKVYAPDSSFRIFTWQLFFTTPVKIPGKYTKSGRDTTFQKPVFRYYGVIQMRSTAMKIFPLFDAGDTLSYGTQQVLGPNNWWGQLYYNIIEKTVNGKSYYTLFGFEAGDETVRRKIIDILSFDTQGKPKFGAPMFYIKHDEDSLHYSKADTLTRFFIEYKLSASTVLNYDSKLEMIVFDHVAPPNEKAKGATFSYVPDGTYEGFKWTGNRWNWVEKVFTFAINEDDNPPIPVPLYGHPAKQPELPKDNEGPK